jgi:hypothetical protein
MTCSYSAAAKAAYAAMKDCFKKSDCGDYWKLGNAFDTMTEYLRWWPATDSSLAQTVYKRYQVLLEPPICSKQRSDCWYDDFSWWGIASAKAFDPAYDSFFPASYKAQFQTIARETWTTVIKGKSNPDWTYKGAPNVWTNRDNGNPDKAYWDNKANWATPRFPKGVWQYDIFHVKREKCECSPGTSNPSDPNKADLGPFQNTVMNGLYWVLALRMYKFTKGPSALDAAKAEYEFLKAWFDEKLGPDSLLLSSTNPNDPTKLVRERVPTYAELDGIYPKVKRWAVDPGWCWGGDQGLILGGLVEYLNFANDQQIAAWAQMILGGVATRMVKEKVVQPYYPDTPPDDYQDYKCGNGVFMRYLLTSYVSPNSPIKVLIDQNKFNLRDVLLASAENACSAVAGDLFDNLNVLSTLTTAKALKIIT